MEPPVGRIIHLRLYPARPPWSLGSGWAAVSGGLAVAGFDLLPETLLSLLIVWLLADPVLGMVWDLGVGSTSPAKQRGIWRRLISPRLPDVAAPLRLLPYTQTGSPSHRLACRLGRLRHWWRDILWPEAGREFATVVAVLGLALLLGALLGRNVLALVLVSIALSWLAVLSRKRDTDRYSARRGTVRKGSELFWHALGEFGIPWLIGIAVLGSPSWAAILLGVCYTITYFGLIHDANTFRLIGTSQAAAALLLASLRHPLTAGAVAILLTPQWGLYHWAAYPVPYPGSDGKVHAGAGFEQRQVAYGTYLWNVQPFVILSMLLAALALAK